MNKFIVILIIIILIVGGFFLFYGKSNTPTIENQTPNSPESSTQTANVQSKVVITYTDAGFMPQTITIKSGDIVTFVNQSSRKMWTASDPHPAHTNYPDFDEKVSVGKGESWSFVFDKVGSWGYHNHNNPSDTGTIVVK